MKRLSAVRGRVVVDAGVIDMDNYQKKIAPSLAAAALTLLQSPQSYGEPAQDFSLDAGVLYYSEGSDGVQVLKPAVHISGKLQDDDEFSLLLTTDAMTGATPNGAVVQQSSQTFTSPSGGRYQIAAGGRPREDGFKDYRVSIKGSYSFAVNENNRFLLNGYTSKEFDYASVGVGGGILHDFNNKNSTLNVELNAYLEKQDPRDGGIPVGFTPMLASTQNSGSNSSDTKNIFDFNLGLTQVLTRYALIKINLNLNNSTGYLTNPYQILSVLGANGNITNDGLINVSPDALPYVFEQRPDERLRSSVFGSLVHDFDGDVLHFSYRYYWDDWDVRSNTFDVRYRLRLSDKQYLSPHIRYYQQSDAAFYRPHLTQGIDVDANGQVLLDAASADYRLARFSSYVIGLGYGIRFASTDEMVVRLEYLTEQFDRRSDVRADQQLDDLTALSLQVSYSYFW